MLTYTETDTGCYIDGGLGPDHAVERMIALLRGLSTETEEDSGSIGNLITDLTDNADGEFVGEILDEATEILQGHTDPGLVWFWDAGDLLLTKEEEIE